MFDVTARGATLQAIATIPEALWELSFGIYLIVRGFKPSPVPADAGSEPVTRAAGS